MQRDAAPILVIGANGQVGHALRTALSGNCIFTDRSLIDLSHLETLSASLHHLNPSLIINAAAYTAVDKAEEERELAYTVNALAVKIMAEYAREQHIPLIHYSTDYVFNGSGVLPWQEEDTPEPLNYYGVSKRAGEEFIQQSGASYLILRTSWVYDALHTNFLRTMLRLGKERTELRIVDDQVGTPTSAYAIAEATQALVSLIQRGEAWQPGIYHCTGQGYVSWHGFAEKIFASLPPAVRGSLAVKRIIPIPSHDYPTPAQRPLNSRLNCQKMARTFGITLPHWEESLARCLALAFQESSL